jgi:hypothetical protein
MSSCPRLFEVEAARDGRLTGPELARFRSHVDHCAVCAREAGALDDLSQSLRSLPALASDELHVRRERTRLLAAFDAALVPARASTRRWLIPLLSAATLTTLALTLWYSRVPSPKAPVALKPPTREAISVQASPASQWSRQTESHRETITLTAGTLSVAIDHALSPRRLRVVLPDGELEDLGTTFTVTATSTATTHVSVQDGTVILRLRERAPVVLNANDSWSPSTPAPLPAPTAAASPVRIPALPREPAAAPPASSPVAPDESAAEFRAALSAFNGGSHALAAELFSAFLARHPSAASAEDAAYLRVLALQRTGNDFAMRAAARDYLARYPRAFRRAEVEPLAR